EADDGRIFQLTGDTAKLTEHISHGIEITGDAASSETASNSNGQSTLNIRDVKMISTSCKAGSSSSMPQSDTSSTSSSPAAAPATTEPVPSANTPGEAPVTSQTPAQTTGSEKTTAPDAAAGTATGESVPSATQSEQSTSKPNKKKNSGTTTPHFRPTSYQAPGSAAGQSASDQNAAPGASSNAQAKSANGSLPKTATPLPVIG